MEGKKAGCGHCALLAAWEATCRLKADAGQTAGCDCRLKAEGGKKPTTAARIGRLQASTNVEQRGLPEDREAVAKDEVLQR